MLLNNNLEGGGLPTTRTKPVIPLLVLPPHTFKEDDLATSPRIFESPPASPRSLLGKRRPGCSEPIVPAFVETVISPRKERQNENDWEHVVATTPRPTEQKRRIFEQYLNWNPGTSPSWLLYPTGSAVYEAFNYLLVAPLTLVTPLNLFYQIYLMEIFHTNIISRGIHSFMMPLIAWTYLLFAAQFEIPFGTVDSDANDLLAIRGNAALTFFFFTWYLVWGFKCGAYCFGFFMIPHLSMMWFSSNVFYLWTRYATSEATWYSPSPLWANPITLAIIFSLVQTLSHVSEDLPPRMNGTNHWMSLYQYICLHWERKWFPVLSIGVSIVAGTISEFLAGPRLLPLLVLRQMYTLGYQTNRWKEIKRVVAMARRSSNPAIDYFGEGGSLPPLKSGTPQTLAEAQQEVEELRCRCERRKQSGDHEMDEDEQARMAYLLLLIERASASNSISVKQPKKEPIGEDVVVVETGEREIKNEKENLAKENEEKKAEVLLLEEEEDEEDDFEERPKLVFERSKTEGELSPKISKNNNLLCPPGSNIRSRSRSLS